MYFKALSQHELIKTSLVHNGTFFQIFSELIVIFMIIGDFLIKYFSQRMIHVLKAQPSDSQNTRSWEMLMVLTTIT